MAVDRTAGQGDVFEVLPDNWNTIRAWLACETQWRIVPGPGGAPLWLGLDYQSLDVVLRRGGYGDEVFDGVCLMERVALPILAKGES